jgi:protein-S-isoprenylcysteine O-methyltransferase Ste14
MSETLRHISAILALPFVMAILVPLLLVTLTGTFNPGWRLPFPADVLVVLLGASLIAGGLLLVVTTVKLFITAGRGTLAPWDPTQRLVVTGVYRYVRNPMISGVFTVLLGEGLLLGSLPVLVWALGFAVVNMIYIPLKEEPGLRQRFGDEYLEYARHVPRWLPRRTPWTPPQDRQG